MAVGTIDTPGRQLASVPAVGRGGARRGGGAALALFLACLGFYLLTASGHFYATDEETIFRLTESMVERRTAVMPDGWGLATTTGRDGQQYSVYGPVQSVLAIPLYVAGRVATPLLPPDARGYILRFAVSLFGAFVTAATVALLYLLARRLRYGTGAALALALIYGLATGAWPHGRTFFAEPLTALFLLLIVYAFRRGTDAGVAPGPLLVGGVATVGALAAKPHAAIALPFLALYLLYRAILLWRERGEGRRGLGAAIRVFAWVGAGLALAAIPEGIYNTALYGGPLTIGYGSQDDLFVIPFGTGFLGLTIGPGKGLLWYSPPVLLALVGWWPFLRRCRAEALVCLGVVAAHYAFYSRILAWHGDGSWGPRYLMIMLPFAVIPALGVLDGLRGHTVWRALVALVVAFGIAVQLLGVAVNFDWYILRSQEDARHFVPAASPLLAHVRYLGERVGEWRTRLLPPPDSAVLTRGFAAADPPVPGAGPLFPRWTTGAGTIVLHPATRAPLLVKLTFFDNRPRALRTDRATVLLSGAPLPAGAVTEQDITGTGEGWIDSLTIPAGALAVDGTATLTLRSATWNPARAGVGERDEPLGVFVHNVEVWRAGTPLTVRDALPLPPMPDTPRSRFWWFNDDRGYDETRHHLVDSWAWYAAVAGFPRAQTIRWLALNAALGATVLLAGLALGGVVGRESWVVRKVGRRRRAGPGSPQRRGDAENDGRKGQKRGTGRRAG